jgi:hypothetical protein
MAYICSFFALTLAYCAFRVEPGGIRPYLVALCLVNLLGAAQGIYDGDLERFGLNGHAHVNEGSYKGP